MSDEQVVVKPVEPALVEPAVVEPAEQTEDQQDAEYEAAFNETVAKHEAEKAGTEPDLPDPDKEEPKQQEAEAPAAVVAPVAVTTKEKDEEVLALVPEERRDALARRLSAGERAEARARKLENDNRSLAGRMFAYQRRYEEAAGKRPVEVQKQATAEQSTEWKQFVEDYPDIAKAIESRVPQNATATSPEIKDVVEYVEQQKRERYLTDAWEAVESVHAGWRDVAKSQEFRAWKATSPAYEKLASSDDVADAIALLDLYIATTTRSAPNVDPTQAANAAKLAARREAQAEGARSPKNRAQAPNESVDLNDPDQLFAFYAQKSNQRLKARYGN